MKETRWETTYHTLILVSQFDFLFPFANEGGEFTPLPAGLERVVSHLMLHLIEATYFAQL